MHGSIRAFIKEEPKFNTYNKQKQKVIIFEKNYLQQSNAIVTKQPIEAEKQNKKNWLGHPVTNTLISPSTQEQANICNFLFFLSLNLDMIYMCNN